MDCDELALQMRRQLGDREAMTGGDSLDLVAIGSRIGCLDQIKQARVPARYLHPPVAERSGPATNRVE